MAKKTSVESADEGARRPPATVGFRVDPADMEMLSALAEAKSMSVGGLAKEWVLERLENPEPASNCDAGFESVHAHLKQFRREFALSVEALLIASGTFAEEESRRWVDEKIRHKPHAVDQQSGQGG